MLVLTMTARPIRGLNCDMRTLEQACAQLGLNVADYRAARGEAPANLRIIIAVLPEDCAARLCDCEPGECRFSRCEDCDGLVDGQGRTIDPRGACNLCKAD